jgi:CheY-like chemotaxis protein
VATGDRISDLRYQYAAYGRYELIREIRESEPQNEPKIPAVALTAWHALKDRMKALTAGYQMHVPKPVEISELYAVVAGSLDCYY